MPLTPSFSILSLLYLSFFRGSSSITLLKYPDTYVHLINKLQKSWTALVYPELRTMSRNDLIRRAGGYRSRVHRFGILKYSITNSAFKDKILKQIVKERNFWRQEAFLSCVSFGYVIYTTANLSIKRNLYVMTPGLGRHQGAILWKNLVSHGYSIVLWKISGILSKFKYYIIMERVF